MQTIRKFLYFILVLVFLGLVGFVFVNYYGFIFSKKIEGQVFQIERITQPAMLLSSGMLGKGNSAVTPAEAMYSFAVAIRTKDGQIFTSSSEDRQWAVAQRGICVEAKFYPYPPWNLNAAGTYHNARLIALKECPPDMGPLPEPTEIMAPPPQQDPNQPAAPVGN